MEKAGKSIVASIEENCRIVEAVKELENHFSTNYHLILVLKLKFISTQFKERELDEIKVKYCHEILPILQKLEGGHSPAIAQAAKELSKTQISLFTDDLRSKKLTNEEYLKKIKPFILVQMEAKKWSS